MSQSTESKRTPSRLSRRRMLQATGAGGVTMVPGLGPLGWAQAQDKPALGTWPAGSQGGTVYLAAAVPAVVGPGAGDWE